VKSVFSGSIDRGGICYAIRTFYADRDSIADIVAWRLFDVPHRQWLDPLTADIRDHLFRRPFIHRKCGNLESDRDKKRREEQVPRAFQFKI
jgi:hypothetical protein